MDLQLDQDQLLIKEVANKYVEDKYQFDFRRKLILNQDIHNLNTWNDFANLGWLALPFDEEYGGLLGSITDVMVLMESFGKGLILEPYLSSVILGGRCLERFGNSIQKEKYLKPLTTGDVKLSLAFSEPDTRYELNHIETTAEKKNNLWVLKGKKSLVLGASKCNFIIIPAKEKGSARDSEEVIFFLVPRNSKNINFRFYNTVDNFDAADIEINELEIEEEYKLNGNNVNNNFSEYEKLIDYATIAICSEALGIMCSMYEKTLDYIKTRKQFGKTIGSFQVIQHRVVEMFIKTEEMRSLTYMSNVFFDKKSDIRKKNISAVKIFLGTEGKKLGEEAIQIHGGMGVADEMQISHYFKRLVMLDIMFGNSDYHFDRFAKNDNDL